MSAMTDSWQQLYRSQTEACGALTATVSGITAPAVISELNSDQIFAAGGQAEAGGYSLQMLVSSFQSLPSKFDPVTVSGFSLQVGNTKTNNGVLYVEAVDFVAQE